DAAVAVLVGGEILEDRGQGLAVRVSGIFEAGMRAAGNTESVVGCKVPVEHERVVVGVGNVALELAERRATRPGGLADLRVGELTVRVLRQRHPETIGVDR